MRPELWRRDDTRAHAGSLLLAVRNQAGSCKPFAADLPSLSSWVCSYGVGAAPPSSLPGAAGVGASWARDYHLIPHFCSPCRPLSSPSLLLVPACRRRSGIAATWPRPAPDSDEMTPGDARICTSRMPVLCGCASSIGAVAKRMYWPDRARILDGRPGPLSFGRRAAGAARRALHDASYEVAI